MAFPGDKPLLESPAFIEPAYSIPNISYRDRRLDFNFANYNYPGVVGAGSPEVIAYPLLYRSTSVSESHNVIPAHRTKEYLEGVFGIAMETNTLDMQDAQFEGFATYYEPPLEAAITTSSARTHIYRRLPIIDQGFVDVWLHALARPKRTDWKCIGTNCGQVFRWKSDAEDHVYKQHLGNTKLFECIECKVQFSSKASAARHRDNQTKRFRCTVANCPKKFARVDYRNLHQKHCGSEKK